MSVLEAKLRLDEEDGHDGGVDGQDRVQAGTGHRLGAEGPAQGWLTVGGARDCGHGIELRPPDLSFSCRATFASTYRSRYGGPRPLGCGRPCAV